MARRKKKNVLEEGSIVRIKSEGEILNSGEKDPYFVKHLIKERNEVMKDFGDDSLFEVAYITHLWHTDDDDFIACLLGEIEEREEIASLTLLPYVDGVSRLDEIEDIEELEEEGIEVPYEIVAVVKL